LSGNVSKKRRFTDHHNFTSTHIIIMLDVWYSLDSKEQDKQVEQFELHKNKILIRV
jgi:hypothetical protein